MNNPSRGPDPPYDEGYKGRPQFSPLMSEEELLEEEKKHREAEIVETICKAFSIPLRAVRKASYSWSQEYIASGRGLTEVIDNPFPAILSTARPFKGKGGIFTLNRMLLTPLAYPLFSEFFTNLPEDSEEDSMPRLLIGTHPRINMIAVTDLPIFPLPGSYMTQVDRNAIVCKKWKKGEELDPDYVEPRYHRIVFGELRTLLLAMREQDVWSPF